MKMNPETDTIIDLRPQYTFLTKYAKKILLYVAIFIIGAVFSQVARNLELTMAVGLAVRVILELLGAAITLALIALGAWTAIRLLTVEGGGQ